MRILIKLIAIISLFLLCDEWPEKNYSTYFTRDEKNGIGKNTILEITAERKEIDW